MAEQWGHVWVTSWHDVAQNGIIQHGTQLKSKKWLIKIKKQNI